MTNPDLIDEMRYRLEQALPILDAAGASGVNLMMLPPPDFVAAQIRATLEAVRSGNAMGVEPLKAAESYVDAAGREGWTVEGVIQAYESAKQQREVSQDEAVNALGKWWKLTPYDRRWGDIADIVRSFRILGLRIVRVQTHESENSIGGENG